MKKSTRNHVPPCATLKVVPFALVAAFLSLSPLGAKTVEIDNTGYRLTVPDSFIVSKPPGAPDILLNGSRPDDKGTIQVVRDNPQGIAAQMAAVYEGKMQGALGNFSLQRKDLRTVNGRTCEFRQYQSFSGGMQIRVLALFYADGQQGFVIHSIDTTDSPVEFERALLSLQPPAPANPGLGAMPKLPSFSADGPAGVVPIGNSGFTFAPPPGWQQFPSDQPTGLQYGLPDKTAVMEVLAVDIGEPIPDRAAFLDASLTQIESSFGPGWTTREHTPHANGGVNVLFKRFAGQLSGRDAQLLTIALTDGTQLVLAYGYYAAELVSTSGNAMRDSILSIKAGPGSSPSVVATPPPTNIPPIPSPPPQIAPAPNPPALPGFSVYEETTTDVHVPYPTGWNIERTSSVVTISGPQGTPAYDTTINVQALTRSDPSNRDLAAAVAKFTRGFEATGARISNSEPFTLAGAPAHRLDAVANAAGGNEGFTHVFHYVLIERPETIALVSYVAPIPNWNDYLPTVNASEAAIRLGHQTGSQAVTSPQPPSTMSRPAAGKTRTSVDVWRQINSFAQAKDWEILVEFLDPEALKNSTLRYLENELSGRGIDLSGYPTEPTERLRRILERVPGAADRMSYLAVTPLEITTREENENLHLVMVKWGTQQNQETYYWMKRINGYWKHAPN